MPRRPVCPNSVHARVGVPPGASDCSVTSTPGVPPWSLAAAAGQRSLRHAVAGHKQVSCHGGPECAEVPEIRYGKAIDQTLRRAPAAGGCKFRRHTPPTVGRGRNPAPPLHRSTALPELTRSAARRARRGVCRPRFAHRRHTASPVARRRRRPPPLWSARRRHRAPSRPTREKRCGLG
jgi:hypothetical protein